MKYYIAIGLNIFFFIVCNGCSSESGNSNYIAPCDQSSKCCKIELPSTCTRNNAHAYRCEDNTEFINRMESAKANCSPISTTEIIVCCDRAI